MSAGRDTEAVWERSQSRAGQRGDAPELPSCSAITICRLQHGFSVTDSGLLLELTMTSTCHHSVTLALVRVGAEIWFLG